MSLARLGIKINDAEIAVLESSCIMLGFITSDPPWGVGRKRYAHVLIWLLPPKWVRKGDALNGNHAAATKEDCAATY